MGGVVINIAFVLKIEFYSNIKNSAFLQLTKPDTKPTLGGLRPGSASPAHQHSQSVSPVSVSSTTQNRYASFEFTEDPFKNYRYDDLFNIADPFEDDNAGLDKNKNQSRTSTTGGKTDPFGFQTDDLAYETPIGADAKSFEAKFPKIDAFDSDFTFGNDPFSSPLKSAEKVNGNSDSFFSSKNLFSDKNSNKSDPFASKKPQAPVSTVLDGKNMVAEDLQMYWAAQESLRLEEERRKQEAQEKADFEYALALSKKDSKDNSTLGREKKKIKNLLRLGRHSPAT